MKTKTFIDTDGNAHDVEQITSFQVVRNFNLAAKLTTYDFDDLEVLEEDFELDDEAEVYINVEINFNEWVAVDMNKNQTFLEELSERISENVYEG